MFNLSSTSDISWGNTSSGNKFVYGDMVNETFFGLINGNKMISLVNVSKQEVWTKSFTGLNSAPKFNAINSSFYWLGFDSKAHYGLIDIDSGTSLFIGAFDSIIHPSIEKIRIIDGSPYVFLIFAEWNEGRVV